MTKSTKQDASDHVVKAREAALRVEALGQVLTQAIASVKTSLDKQNGAVLGLFALVAALPATADADPARIGAAIEAMTAGLPNQDALRDEMAKTASRAVLLARRLRDEADTSPA